MLSTLYKKYHNRYRIAIILFFAVITYCFGTFSVQDPDLPSDSKNMGVLLLISIGLIFIISQFAKVKNSFKNKYIYLIVILICWLFFIAFFRDDIIVSFNNFLNILFTQVFILVVANLMWQVPIIKLLKWFFIYLQCVLFLCLVVHLNNVGPLIFGTHKPADRMGGLFFYGITGDLAGFGIVLSYFLYNSSKNVLYKFVYLAGAFVFLFYILAADMRIAFLGIGSAIFIQYIFRRLAQKKSTWPSIVLFFILFIGYQLYTTYNSGGANVDSDVDVRLFIWSLASLAIAEQPIFGYGDYSSAMRQLGDANRSINLINLHDPHSSYLSLTLQSGFVALIIFIVLNVKVFRNIKALSPYYKGIISFLVYWLVCGITGGNFFDFNFNIANVFFEMTIFVFLLHPDIQKNVIST